MKKSAIFGVVMVIASILGFSVPASACGTGGSSTMYKHCDKGYRADWRAGKFGRGGPWDPNAGMHRRQTMPVYATGAHYDRRVARGYYGRPTVQRGGPVLVRRHVVVRRAIATGVVGGGAIVAHQHATRTVALPPPAHGNPALAAEIVRREAYSPTVAQPLPANKSPYEVTERTGTATFYKVPVD